MRKVTGKAIKGLAELLDKLSDLDAMQQDEALELGLAMGGAKAVERAAELAPVDSGDLRDNLHVGGYTKLTPRYRAVGAYGELKKPGGRGKSKWVLVGTKLPYAHLVEMGSVHNRPTRFLLRGVTESEREIVREVDAAIQEIIDR
jgi:HK97 gp10 family phage protein